MSSRERADALPPDLVRGVRRLDEAQLRRLMILARGLLAGSDGDRPHPGDIPGTSGLRYRRQTVRCGRNCASCPHGPYWYAHWTEQGQRRSLYIGRELPAEVRRLLEEDDRRRGLGHRDPEEDAAVIVLDSRRDAGP